MASEMVEKRPTKPQQTAPLQVEHDPLPCPRCESTNTKFCYYNNYNFSQPRHFCKACRRYWTHGGALRDIPIGGATRKSAKRSRTSSSSSSTPVIGSESQVFVSLPSLVSDNTPVGVSFTSLLSNANAGGFGFGFDHDVGLGIQRGVCPFPQVGYGFAVGGVNNGDGGVNREDTWQAGSGGDCFSFLPELAISSIHGNGMK